MCLWQHMSEKAARLFLERSTMRLNIQTGSMTTEANSSEPPESVGQTGNVLHSSIAAFI